MTTRPDPRRLLPGLVITAVAAAFAAAAEHAETLLWHRAWLESLVLAIIIGALWRTLLGLPEGAAPGVRFAAKPVMELAIAAMGASASLTVLVQAGPWLIGAIVAVIVLTIAIGYRLGRWLGLSARMAMLVACGNAICGNSAIAAVGPAIAADGEEIAAAVGFTAVMGIAVVLAVAPVAHAIGLGTTQGGILAGMMVYAVPQVLAAAAPLGGAAVQVGTLVKLVRVLLLAPVVAVLGARHRRETGDRGTQSGVRVMPGFIVAFLMLAGLRAAGLIPDAWAAHAHDASLALTVVAMAGLGLGVDLRSVARAGPRVTASVIASLAVLFVGALAVIAWG